MINFDYTLLIQFAQFLILLILLDVFLFRPVISHLSRRKSAVLALSARVEEKKGEAEGLSRAYEEGLNERKLPVLAEREASLKEAHAASMKVIEEARRDLAEELSKIRQTVSAEGEATLSALMGLSDRLASEIAVKLTGRGA